ncbi:hypothetical protein X560_1623 [Listeria fleischmannii 1991]|uniref:Uncharacterized protein n=1 Tax=Listeria fleischmannii 1991 TaxID=1430899 RepID=A0A0J8GB93_9LIST|nr:hypothetical protein X560_1623 [Listeria fleischmannii 1991]
MVVLARRLGLETCPSELSVALLIVGRAVRNEEAKTLKTTKPVITFFRVLEVFFFVI